MFLIALTLAAIALTSAAFYFGAWAFTQFKPANEAWSALWATCLLGPLLSPLAGFGLMMLAPQDMAALAEGLSLHSAGPIVQEIGGLRTQVEAQVAMFDTSAALILVLSIYAFGVARQLGRLLIGRRRVRQIVLGPTFLVPLGRFRVFASYRAEAPFVWTPFGRPTQSRIILPASYFDRFTEAELVQIAQHENAHIIRRDDEFGVVLRAAMALLWCSPFSHAAFAKWVQACELQCDAAILSGQSHQLRSAYAQTLLKALHLTANRVRQYPAATFSTQRLRNEKMRITSIMAGTAPVIKRKRERASLILAAALLILPGGFGFANLANADPAGKAPTASPVLTLGEIVTGRLTAPFGKTFDPFRDGSTRVHRGVDIAAPIGTAIRAPADGVVVAATDLYDNKPAYGKVVVLDTASGTRTLFSHLNDYKVEPGQQVRKGELIAEVGNTGKSTGPHVHIETYVNGTRMDPTTVWSASE